ncbi:SAM-dependent methyltransferase [Paraliomyxa miuraensis]|uniref:SAM-dependent methyltransferase n=1 Tax=Paraliomyxa miuraensis TaxID=376150 RepID=UPI00225C2C9D|nr:cyclopropane-fatty-acyl-phospholipid synthase family protein [Paraliomyxa miuraensis]MCX4242214.1 cyclopropane-fatty-acyl-phospholipid synthase family protein [Paraliomyxa miuraensis]
MDASFLGDIAIGLAESGRVPDGALRWAIRRLCRQRLRDDVPDDPALAQARVEAFVAAASRSEIAPLPDHANAQHYEVPAAFFQEVLGPHLKYSCGLWEPGASTLVQAEEAALRQTCEHAALADGQRVLELGCGWGSLTLWMAERLPSSHITAVSNSGSQRAFIEDRARTRGLSNVEVVTADINDFEPAAAGFDRVVSVEMFEHVRNHGRLLRRIARWLDPEGMLLVHLFCHRDVPYAFGTEGTTDWMGRNFFSGGTMPSDGLLLRHQDDLRVRAQWRWPGTHYERTANAWLANLDERSDRVLAIMGQTYGQAHAHVWRQRWRMFFMGCAELFGYDHGRQWWVSHYRLGR